MQNLHSLIKMLEKGRKIHISVLDLSGILDLSETKLPFKSTIHSKEFCYAAKETESGRRVCFRCKALANERAAIGKCAFEGVCSFGIYEYALPVIIGDSAAAVVYVGNAIINEKEQKARLIKTASLAKSDTEKLLKKFEEAEILESSDDLRAIAEIVSDYLRLLYERAPKSARSYHWLVSAMKRYADKTFTEPITLSEISAIYHKNAKYLGRLYKREMGISYSDYLLNLRLANAEQLLIKSDSKIIEIALASGFNSISYFNREFLKKNGVSPGEFRKSRNLSGSK